MERLLALLASLLSGAANAIQPSQGKSNSNKNPIEESGQSSHLLAMLDVLKDIKSGIWTLVGKNPTSVTNSSVSNNNTSNIPYPSSRPSSLPTQTTANKIPTEGGQGGVVLGHVIGNALKNQKGSAANAVGTAADFSALIPAIGPAVSGLLRLGEVSLKAVGFVSDWSHSIHEANMQFADFSASMAGVQARQQLRDVLLKQERGEERAPQAEKQAKAMNRLDKAMAPYQDRWADGLSKWSEWFSDTTATAITQFRGVLTGKDEIAEQINNMKANEENKIDASSWLNDALKNSNPIVDYGRPPRFGTSSAKSGGRSSQ